MRLYARVYEYFPQSPLAGEALYDLPRFGQVSFLHMTDCHAQLLPIHFREPSINMGLGSMNGKWPHLVGEHLLKAAGVPDGTATAHALTYLNFETAARRYGKVGGFAHLATLVKQLKDSRPGALLLDGGDTWQGSGTALWTQGQDMVDNIKKLTPQPVKYMIIASDHGDHTGRVQQLIGASERRIGQSAVSSTTSAPNPLLVIARKLHILHAPPHISLQMFGMRQHRLRWRWIADDHWFF